VVQNHAANDAATFCDVLRFFMEHPVNSGVMRHFRGLYESRIHLLVTNVPSTEIALSGLGEYDDRKLSPAARDKRRLPLDQSSRHKSRQIRLHDGGLTRIKMIHQV